MQFRYSPYMLPLLGAAIASGWVAIYAWRHRATRSAPALAVLAAAIAFWAAGYALEIGGADLATKLFWGKVQYFGIVSVPVLWYIFAYNYFHQDKQVTPRTIALLFIVPLITVILVWTTEAHNLIWRDIRLNENDSFSALGLSYGLWFWVHSAYSYLLLLIGTIFILRSLRRAQTLYREQAAALLIAVLAPWIGNILYLSGLSPIPYLDLTPFAFTISVVALAWAILGFSLLSLAPVARELVVDDMSDGMLVLDAHNIIADINPAAQQLLQVTSAQAIGQPIADLLRAWPQLAAQYGQVSETQDEISIGEGEDRRWYEVRISPLQDRRDRLVGRVIIVRNITERKQTADRLQQERNLLRTVIDNVPDPIFVRDLTGRYLLCNVSDARVLGVDHPEEVLGKTDFDFYPHALAVQFQLDNQAVLESGQPIINREERARDQDGEARWVLTTKVPLRDPQGQISGLVSIARDVTERKRAEEQIRQLSRAVEASPASIVITDTRGSIQYVNPKFTEVTGYTAQESLGQNPKILKTDFTPREVHQQLWETIQAGREWHGEFCNRKKNGELYWEWASISPIVDASGHTTHYVAVKEDITERKHAQEELATARDQALAASRYKSELLAKVSHELRTPLGAILGYAEFLHHEMFAPLTTQQKHFTSEILDSVDYLTSLVNDLLDQAQIERGQITIQPAPFNPRQMVDQLNTALKPAAEAKGLALTFDVSTAIPVYLTGDQKRIRQILINLINNAIKFTTAGSVVVQLDRPTAHQWQMRVADTGPGISAEAQAKVFETFWQADGSATRQHRGYGLGLSIVKQLTELMGGEIALESEAGRGSTFIITLPLGA